MKSKHILNYSDFIFEQAMDPMAAMGAPAPGAPVKEKPFHFIFIDSPEEDGISAKKYPDGSMSVDFPAFSVTSKELEDWVNKNIISTDKDKMSDPLLDVRRKNLIGIVKGDKVNIGKEDGPFIEKLKNAVSTDIFGRREPDVNVIFTRDQVPTTEDMKVTFIKYKKHD